MMFSSLQSRFSVFFTLFFHVFRCFLHRFFTFFGVFYTVFSRFSEKSHRNGTFLSPFDDSLRTDIYVLTIEFYLGRAEAVEDTDFLAFRQRLAVQ